MHRIRHLDLQLSSLFENFADVASTLEPAFVCTLADMDTIARQAYPGIYRIDIATGAARDVDSWMRDFTALWEGDGLKHKFTPGLKKKRVTQHKELPEWLPLYLGKSKRVAARVLEHIQLGADKPTFALKLQARKWFEPAMFRLHTLEVDVQNYDLIVPALESALRERFHPIIGKQ